VDRVNGEKKDIRLVEKIELDASGDAFVLEASKKLEWCLTRLLLKL